MEQRLISELAEANAQIVLIRRDRDRLRNQAKRKRFDGFTFIQRRTALILYIMGDFDKRPVVWYLLSLMQLMPQNATEADRDSLYRVVEDWFLASNDVEVDSFMRETLPGDASLFKRAQSILNDNTLRDWVFSMNVCKGLAPAGRDVAIKYDSICDTRMSAFGGLLPRRRHNLELSVNRSFFIRWRGRMAIKIGKIQTREAFTRTQIAAKVAVP